MNGNHPPTIAKWLLRYLATSRNLEAISGDLDEQYGHGRSRVWYWRQVAVAIIVSTFKDIRNHKLLTLRALIVGWFVFWFLWGRLIQYGVPFFETATRAVVEGLFKSLFADIPFEGGVVGRAPYFEFMSFVGSVGHVENVFWFCYGAFATLGFCIVGIVSGWIVGRLHRRKVSMVLAHAAAVLAYWIVTSLTIHPESYPPFYWLIAILTLGILFGGVLCASRRSPTGATWLLRHFGCSPKNEIVIGDLHEQYRNGRSRGWYWRQVVIAIVVSFCKELWSNKVRAVVAIATGWVALSACYLLLRPPIFLWWADLFPWTLPANPGVLNLAVTLVRLVIVVVGGEISGKIVNSAGGSSRRAMLLFYVMSLLLASTWILFEVSFAESRHDRDFAWPIVGRHCCLGFQHSARWQAFQQDGGLGRFNSRPVSPRGQRRSA